VTARLFVFCLALGGLRDPRLFAVAGAAAWFAVWREKPALGPAAAWLPWLGWAALSAALSVQPLAGLPVVARWAAVLACASLAAAWSEREREDWLRSLLIVAAALAVAALATGANRGWRAEMTGLLPPHYNYTAFVLAAAASAAAAWLLHPRGARGAQGAGAAALLALALVCIALSRSRGALLGLGCAAAVWSARRWGTLWLSAWLAAASVGAIALGAGLLPAAVEDAVFKRSRTHAESRPRIWSAAAAIASESPALGVGPGNFAVGFRRRPVAFEDGAARWAMSTPFAHSEPLQAAAETGWAGLALWLLGGGAALWGLVRRSDAEPAREAAAVAAASMTAQLLVDNVLQIPALAALWLTALALARPPSDGKGWPRAAMITGAALALVSWIPRTFAAAGPARAAAVFPAEPGPREDLAYIAMAAGKAAEAEAHWTAAQRLEPFNAIHPWRRAQIAGSFAYWERVEPLAARSIELEPDFLNARLLRADALLHLGRRDEARAELGAARDRLRARGEAAPLSGYEKTVLEFDRPAFDRLSARANASASSRK